MHKSGHFFTYQTKQEVFDLCKRVKESNKGEVVWLFGEKHLISEVRKEFSKDNIAADFTTAPEMVENFIKDFRSSDKKESVDFDKKDHIDTVLVDNIDYLFEKERTQELFAHFILTRHISDNSTIIASKLSPEKFEPLRTHIEKRVISPIFVEVKFSL